MIKTRQERLNEVYEYLRENYGIHTKTQFATVLKITQPALSSAMNGNESYLTDNLFKRICAEYQGVFNLDYLLNGEGQLLAQDNAQVEDEDTIAWMKTRMAEKDELITTQRQLILALQDKISELKAKLKVEGFDNFPFQQDNKDAKELNLVQL